MSEPANWILRESPRGYRMPIDCVYRFSFGEQRPSAAHVPAGWSVLGIPHDDPAVADFPTAQIEPPLPGAMFVYLVNPQGVAVATWDEGRWWTPEESRAWLLMLAVPDTYVIAEGMREASMPRWWRRRKRK